MKMDNKKSLPGQCNFVLVGKLLQTKEVLAC